LNIPSLQFWRRFLDALFLISAFKKKVSCLSILDIVSLHVPASPVREFPTFTFIIAPKAFPQPDAFLWQMLCADIDIFKVDFISLNDINTFLTYVTTIKRLLLFRSPVVITSCSSSSFQTL
jgi:hypothetical protein